MHVACYGYRWYGPLDGRWPSRDPMGENLRTSEFNLYAFVRNDGVNWYDDLGMVRLPIPIEPPPVKPPPKVGTGTYAAAAIAAAVVYAVDHMKTCGGGGCTNSATIKCTNCCNNHAKVAIALAATAAAGATFECAKWGWYMAACIAGVQYTYNSGIDDIRKAEDSCVDNCFK